MCKSPVYAPPAPTVDHFLLKKSFLYMLQRSWSVTINRSQYAEHLYLVSVLGDAPIAASIGVDRGPLCGSADLGQHCTA